MAALNGIHKSERKDSRSALRENLEAKMYTARQIRLGENKYSRVRA